MPTDVQKGSCGLEDVDAICAVANSGNLDAAYKMLDQVYEKCGSLNVEPPPEYPFAYAVSCNRARRGESS